MSGRAAQYEVGKKEELNINDFPKANHAVFDLINIPELQYQAL